jgi:hypothetical protein
MSTAVGLITPEKTIKFPHFSQKQMEVLQEVQAYWKTYWIRQLQKIARNPIC